MIEDMEGARHQQDSALGGISEKINNVKQLCSEACLFKVHEELRKTNRDAYTPLIISIGPYHHGKSELSKMEKLKELYLQSFLVRAERNGFRVEDCWKKLKDLKGRAERYYGDEIGFNVGDKFVEMLLLDGCFIVEFLMRSSNEEEVKKYDPIFKISGMNHSVIRDMLLFENQLPFFVLQELYDMIPGEVAFSEVVKFIFADMLPKINYISIFYTNVNTQEIKHLLEVVHIICQPPRITNGCRIIQQAAETDSTRSFCCWLWKKPQANTLQGGFDIESHGRQRQQADSNCCTCFLCKFGNYCTFFLCKFEKQPPQCTDYLGAESCYIPTACELREAGVHFKKVGKIDNDISNENISLFDIKFNHSVLKIPSFGLYDTSESFFRNLIAYEQYSCDMRHFKYFISFARFMDGLINTDKDVILLRKKGIFVNGLGDDAAVSNLFNNLCRGVVYSPSEFYYRDVYKELIQHCNKPWNVLKAKLSRDYFHSPWAGISTIAAIWLLSLTTTQTVIALLDLLK